MKLLVVSDSHGRVQNILSAMEKETPDKIIFTGDGLRDFDKISEGGLANFLDIFKDNNRINENLIKVAGNCDYFYNDEPLTTIKDFGGVQTFITHGHLFKAKFGLGGICKETKLANCKLAIFGHTHSQYFENIEDITLVNPGSIANGKYAVIKITDGKIIVELKSL